MARSLLDMQSEVMQVLLEHQDEAGYWRQSSQDNRLIPYFNHFGANALVLMAERVSDPVLKAELISAVDKWLMWYRNHMRDDGTVYDYQIIDGVEVSTGDYDSTDSYAALFLVVLWNRLQAEGRLEQVKEWMPAVNLAIAAMELTEDPQDGLTYAKPGWPKKYLMDNAELMLGYRAAAMLYAKAGDELKSHAAEAETARIVEAIETQFWFPQEQYYAWAKDQSGAMDAGMSKLYPDALSNILYFAMCGNSGDERHQRHFARLVEMFALFGQGLELKGHILLEHALWWIQAALKLGRSGLAQQLWDSLEFPDLALLPMSVLGHIGRAAVLLQHPGRADWLINPS